VESYLSSPRQFGAKDLGEISETIEFPKTFAVAGNIAVAAWIVLDSIGLSLINLAVGVVFLLVLLIGVYGILKFLGCLRPCYNCKKCTYGLGRLAALYFGKRSLKDYKETYGLAPAVFFYIFIGPLPAVILLGATVQAFTEPKALVLVCLLALTVYSGLTWRRAKPGMKQP
jgi:hypothetical protein